jgi:hypothetical protein
MGAAATKLSANVTALLTLLLPGIVPSRANLIRAASMSVHSVEGISPAGAATSTPFVRQITAIVVRACGVEC